MVRELISNNNTSYPQSNYPCLKIDYNVDGLGEEPFWTLDGPVNMANRNLILGDQDVSYPGRNVNVSIDRTYNNRSITTGQFGYGWCSILDMKLYVPSIGPARLLEADGTAHYFAQDQNGNYASPPGLYWQLYNEGSTATIVTSDGTQYIFSVSLGKLLEIKDGSGNRLIFSYNGTILSRIVDSALKGITITYNANGQVNTIKDEANRSWIYSYSSGNLISVKSPDNYYTIYRYDNAHNLTAVVQPKGNVTYLSYTNDDRISAINSVNAVTNGNFEVDSDGNNLPDHFTIGGGQDGKASIDSSASSPFGQAFKIDASVSNSSNYTVYVSDPIQVDSSKTYTISGYLKGNQASGTHSTVLSLLAYDANGALLGEVGKTANTGTFNWNRVSKSIVPGTSTAFPAGTKTVYAKVGTSNVGGSGTSWFDGIQLEENAAPTSFVCGSQYTANPTSPMSARYDGEGKKHLYTMNDNQNIIKYQQDPDIPGHPPGLNITESYTWDTTIPNTLTSYTNESGKTWKYSHDPAKGNLIKITDPQNKTKTFSWDEKSNLISYTGVKNENSKFTYDGNNNLTSQDPFSTSQAQDYDTNKNLIKETNSLGWADNLVKNSSFEVGTNGLPQYFTFDEGQQSTWGLDTYEKVYGSKSLKLSASSGNGNTYTTLVSEKAPADKTTEYVLSGYLKTDTTSGVQSTVLSVLAYNSSGTLLGEIGRINPSTTADWQRWSALIRPSDFPADTSLVSVKVGVFNSTGSGCSYFDAIQLQKKPVVTAYNLVDNSSFERGSTWPYFWNKSSSGENQWLSATDYVYAGGGAVSIKNATASNGISYQNYIPYEKEKSYSLTAYVKSELSAKVAHIKIEEYDVNKTLITTHQSSSPLIDGKTEWRRVSAELGPNQADSRTAYIRPVLMTGNATGTVYFDNVRLQEGSVTTEYGYESTNTWVNKITDPMGNSTNLTLDPGTGNTLTKTAPDSNVTQYTYDSMDRVITTKPPGSDLLVSYSYDANGNSDTVKLTNPVATDPNKVLGQTKYTYNGLGLLESVMNPLNYSTLYSYTPSGLIKEITTPKEDKVTFEYDKVNRNTDIKLNGTEQYHYGYDVRGNVLSSEDKILNLTWSATYDDNDLLTSWKDSSLGSINYTLDESGNVTQRKLNNLSGSTLKSESITYNKANQPSTLTDWKTNVSKFLFNENKMISNIYSGMDAGNSIISSYSYDDNNRLSNIRNQTNTGKILSSFQYGVNSQTSRIESIKDQTGKTLNFTYTAKGQLETELLSNGNKVSYTYDAIGNSTSQIERTPGGTTVNSTAYSYANNKFQISSVNGKSWSYDESGNVTNDGKNKYTWDASNRITEVRDASTNAVKATYKYDDKGRRIEQTVNGQVTKFLYDGKSNKVLAEYDGAGALLKYYTWSPMGMLLSITVG